MKDSKCEKSVDERHCYCCNTCCYCGAKPQIQCEACLAYMDKPVNPQPGVLVCKPCFDALAIGIDEDEECGCGCEDYYRNFVLGTEVETADEWYERTML